jgi:hypothetical protein
MGEEASPTHNAGKKTNFELGMMEQIGKTSVHEGVAGRGHRYQQLDRCMDEEPLWRGGRRMEKWTGGARGRKG